MYNNIFFIDKKAELQVHQMQLDNITLFNAGHLSIIEELNLCQGHLYNVGKLSTHDQKSVFQ